MSVDEDDEWNGTLGDRTINPVMHHGIPDALDKYPTVLKFRTVMETFHRECAPIAKDDSVTKMSRDAVEQLNILVVRHIKKLAAMPAPFQHDQFRPTTLKMLRRKSIFQLFIGPQRPTLSRREKTKLLGLVGEYLERIIKRARIITCKQRKIIISYSAVVLACLVKNHKKLYEATLKPIRSKRWRRDIRQSLFKMRTQVSKKRRSP